MIAWDLSSKSIPFSTDGPESYKLLPIDQVLRCEDDWWGGRLLRKGVPAEDIQFLVQVLDPDPNERLSAEDIVHNGCLEL